MLHPCERLRLGGPEGGGPGAALRAAAGLLLCPRHRAGLRVGGGRAAAQALRGALAALVAYDAAAVLVTTANLWCVSGARGGGGGDGGGCSHGAIVAYALLYPGAAWAAPVAGFVAAARESDGWYRQHAIWNALAAINAVVALALVCVYPMLAYVRVMCAIQVAAKLAQNVLLGCRPAA